MRIPIFLVTKVTQKSEAVIDEMDSCSIIRLESGANF
jgi:hypothetical protein